jgi:hypothetical protein
MFRDGPEYESRIKRSTFTPPNITLKDVHDAVPKRLFEKNTLKSLYYVFRHLALTYMFYHLATRIGAVVGMMEHTFELRSVYSVLIRGALWVVYWGWQGIAFAGLWCLGR